MSEIFLTGATGFLGSHIAEAVVAAGHEVRCSVRSTSDTRWIDHLGLERVELDLRAGGTSPAEMLVDIRTVIHCGGLTRAPSEAEFMAVNAEGTSRLLRASVEAGVERFVFISSLAARGPDGAGRAISPYGRSKEAAERLMETQAGDLEVVVLRPGGIFGPRDSDLLPMFQMASRGWLVVPRGPAPLQPIYVADVVSAVLAALTAEPPGEPLPVAGDALHPWPEMAKYLAGAVGVEGRVIRAPSAVFWTAGLLAEIGARFTGTAPAMDRRRARDMSHHAWTCELDRTRQALPGWAPTTSIRDGLAQTAAWYREIGWL